MKPQIKLATALTPDGGKMELYQHDRDFLIKVNGQGLMNSRRHESEKELARLGCAHLSTHESPQVLIGGLGMGYTLRQTLDMLGPGATVVVSELLSAVADWNREYLKELNSQPLDDKRTQLIIGDIFPLISKSSRRFDAMVPARQLIRAINVYTVKPEFKPVAARYANPGAWRSGHLSRVKFSSSS